MKVKCPICKKEYDYYPKKGEKLPEQFPFCSKRCQLIDLGAWFDSDYKIENDLKNHDDQQTD